MVLQSRESEMNVSNWQSDVSFTVTPERMYTEADEVLRNIQKMKVEFDKIQATVNKTKGYWIGEAGELYRTKYFEKEPEIEEIFKRMMEHVTDLKQMAAVYSEAENIAQEVAESLPSDVIL